MAINNSELWLRCISPRTRARSGIALGQIDAGTLQLTWIFKDSQPYTNGVSPAVALNDAGEVIDVDQSQNNSTLWFTVGTIPMQPFMPIVWFFEPQQYDTGITPRVAFTSASNVAIEVHQSGAGPTLGYTGRIGWM